MKTRYCGKQGGRPGCGKQLSASRYFNCDHCVKLESEDPIWDGFDDHDDELGDSMLVQIAKSKEAKCIEMFIKCKVCHETKDRTEFNYHPTKTNGRNSECRICHARKLKQYRTDKHAS